MNTNQSENLWIFGPTTCAPQAKILKSIARQIKAKGIVSEHELRIARRTGMVAVEPTSARLGFNDEVIFHSMSRLQLPRPTPSWSGQGAHAKAEDACACPLGGFFR